MTTFTGSATWRATITGPDPAATITAASVVDPDTLLADRTMFLYTELESRFAVIAEGETVLSGTGSIIDLKALTTLTPLPLLASVALPALEADDVILAESLFSFTGEGAAELRHGIDHDDDPLIVAAEYRHLLDDPAALVTVHAHARFAITAAVAAGSTIRAVARMSAAGNTTATVYRAASLRWRLFRKGF